MKVKLPPNLKCSRCGHEWQPRKEEVVICPKCKTPYWDRKRIKEYHYGGKDDKKGVKDEK